VASKQIAKALIKEHHDIDAGIEQFMARKGELNTDTHTGEVNTDTSSDTARESANSLLKAFAALRRHIYLEEEFVFPALADPSLAMAIMVMYREHGSIWRLMDQAEEQISNHSTDQAQIIKTCEVMLRELERHNAKEEPIIYPHTDADLTEEQRQRLVQFLDSGEMPAGWICREAQDGGPADGRRKLPFGT